MVSPESGNVLKEVPGQTLTPVVQTGSTNFYTSPSTIKTGFETEHLLASSFPPFEGCLFICHCFDVKSGKSIG